MPASKLENGGRTSYNQMKSTIRLNYHYKTLCLGPTSVCCKTEKHVAQLLQRDRAAGWVSYGQSGRLELENNILRTLLVYLQHSSSTNHFLMLYDRQTTLSWT